jgi:hypothetical protein
MFDYISPVIFILCVIVLSAIKANLTSVVVKVLIIVVVES